MTASNESKIWNRVCYALAVVVTLAWGWWNIRLGKTLLCDENGHLGIIFHLFFKVPGWPEIMAPLPGYHYLVIWCMPDTLSAPTLAHAREVTLAMALLGGFAFAMAWRKQHGRSAGPATLLLALFPILQPFTALCYSDVPATTVLLFAWWAYVARQRALAAVLLALSCLFRQTNIVWGAFMVALDAMHAVWPPDGAARESWRGIAARIWRDGRWMLIVAIAFVGAWLWAGRLTPGTATGNDMKPNIATLHLAGIIVALFGLPVWLAHAPSAVRAFAVSWRTRTWRTLAWTAATLAVAVVLARTYSNPHPWNRAIVADGESLALLRNAPLVWTDGHPWRETLSGACVVLASIALVVAFARQRFSRELWLTLAFGAALLATSMLVEPRYFITPAVFVLFFLEIRRREMACLAAWWFVVCAVHAPFIVATRSLW